jgi:predicted nucleic acid-binding protein
VIAASEVVGMNDQIKEEAIRLRQTYGLKTPDALIAASAIIMDMTLATADRQFERIHEVSLILVQP